MAEKTPRRRRIGPYRLEKPLGAGGMGEVHQAWDERLHRWVAVKRLRRDLETTPERRRRFRREARAAAGLSHPAIVRIHDILEDEAGDAIVMEYIEGRPLSELIAAGDLDGARAASLARQVAAGLLHAHQHGIVHRDLKTENVMITSEGEARILDFGLARALVPDGSDASLTREGAVVGTVRAMSPEQAAGRDVDTRSDLFSFGVLLYEMFTGRPPFRGENALQVLHQILHQTPPPPRALRPELPAELASVIERLLEKDPARRLGDTRQVAETLARLAESATLEGLVAAAPAEGAASSSLESDAPTRWRTPSSAPAPETGRGADSRRAGSRRAGSRRAWRLLAAAVLVLALVAVAAYFLTPAPRSLRVLVLDPDVAGNHDDAGVFAVGVREALVRTLLALEGVEPLDAKAAGPEPSSPSAAALAAAADEVVTARLDFRDGTCWISLRRLASDARVLWSSEPFETPVGPQYYHQLAGAVASRFAYAYPRRRPRSGALSLEAREEDYATFLEIQHGLLSGRQVPDERQYETLLDLTESSPRFVEAFLLAANVARWLGRVEEARALIERLRRLAPRDPRPLDMLVRVERRAGRVEEARSALEEMERLLPGDLRVLEGRAHLAVMRGEGAEAVRLWRQVVEARPSWQSLYLLAGVELTQGEVEAARGHLERVLELSPKNAETMVRLGRLELLHGDLDRAESLYRTLTETQPHNGGHFTSLATVHYLRRDFAAAVRSLRRALELEPKGRLVRLTLADSELNAGRPEAARALYVELLEELDVEEVEGLDEQSLMILAQCLARLDQPLRAVEIVHTILRRSPRKAEVAFQAALVYALVGDRNSALASAVEARRLGFQPVWFEIPAFDFLHPEPEFRRRVLARKD